LIAISVSQLREEHYQELIATGKVTNATVAAVALQAAAKLRRLNPFEDLRKIVFLSTHSRSLALRLLQNNTKSDPYRSHLQYVESRFFFQVV